MANTFLPNDGCLISRTNSLVSVLKHWIRPFSRSATHSWPRGGTRAKLWGTLNWPGLGLLSGDATEWRKTSDVQCVKSPKLWLWSLLNFKIYYSKPLNIWNQGKNKVKQSVSLPMNTWQIFPLFGSSLKLLGRSIPFFL